MEVMDCSIAMFLYKAFITMPDFGAIYLGSVNCNQVVAIETIILKYSGFEQLGNHLSRYQIQTARRHVFEEIEYCVHRSRSPQIFSNHAVEILHERFRLPILVELIARSRMSQEHRQPHSHEVPSAILDHFRISWVREIVQPIVE